MRAGSDPGRLEGGGGGVGGGLKRSPVGSTPERSPGGRGVGEYGVGASPLCRPLRSRWDYTELTALKEKFQALDAEGKGFLSRQQFYTLFETILDDASTQANDHSPMFNFAYSLFHSSGECLNLKEFVTGMTILSKGSEEERLRYLFHMYDSDSSGYLNAAELKRCFRIMSSYAQSHDFKASESLEMQSLANLRRGNSENMEELALKTLTEHDMDGDGKIGFEDFAKWCSSDPVVKTWMDMLCYDTARGIERMKFDSEQALLAKELDSMGFADNDFWRESFNLNASPGNNNSPCNILPPNCSQETPAGSQIHSDGASSSSTSPGARIARPNHVRTLTQNAIGSFEIDFKTLVLEKQIGSGSFAYVYKCTWLDSPVAVKVFKSGPKLVLNSDGTAVTDDDDDDDEDRERYEEDGESFEPEFDSMHGATAVDANISMQPDDIGAECGNRARFLQEVSLLKSIRHPNLLLYMGACVDPRYPLCIVSELIDGGSLFELLHGENKVRLNLRQKLMLTQDIARGMLYLHGRDPIVLHRDLKSANILVEKQNDDSFKGKIIDFGLSKINSTQASLVPGRGRGMTGSLVTMAPEVMNEQSYQTRSDVYSFGIVCWEIFCGRMPFGSNPPVASLIMAVAVRGDRPKFLKEDNVPAGIQSMIKACWDQDVNKRPDFLVIARMLNGIRQELRL